VSRAAGTVAVSEEQIMSVPFKGKFNVGIRDSVPDWSPFEPPKAPGASGEGGPEPTALPARPGPVSGPGRREALSGR
jgi:hypothetical protein